MIGSLTGTDQRRDDCIAVFFQGKTVFFELFAGHPVLGPITTI